MQQHVQSLLQVVGKTQEAMSGVGSSRVDKEAKVSSCQTRTTYRPT